MRSIDDIAIECKADKASNIHDYCRLYEDIVGHLREKKCSILEIGVKSGASMLLWERAFPMAKVVGVDVDLSTMRFRPERAIVEHGDVLKPGAMKSIVSRHGPFDFVVDDAAHTRECSDAVFGEFPSMLVPGGWLFIEDISQTKDFSRYASEFVTRLCHMREVVQKPAGTPKPWPRKWPDSMPSQDRYIDRMVLTHGLLAIRRTM